MGQHYDTIEAQNIVIPSATQAELEAMVGGIGMMYLNTTVNKVCIKIAEEAATSSWIRIKSKNAGPV
jgi:hypothetical protein